MSLSDHKTHFRRLFLRKRRALSNAQLLSANLKLRHALSVLLLRQHVCISAYVAFDNEPSVFSAARVLMRYGHRFFLPVVNQVEAPLQFAQAPCQNWNRLPMGKFGICAPKTRRLSADGLDVMLIPLVAFDASLNRLGMGGGFYDRTIAELPLNRRPWLLGVAHDCQLCSEGLPSEETDCRLDAVLTPSQLFV